MKKNRDIMLLIRWAAALAAILWLAYSLGNWDGVLAVNNSPVPTPEGIIGTPALPSKPIPVWPMLPAPGDPEPEATPGPIIDKEEDVSVGPVVIQVKIKINPWKLIHNPLYGGE